MNITDEYARVIARVPAGRECDVVVAHIRDIVSPSGVWAGLSDGQRLEQIRQILDALDAAQQEESVTEDCPRCRHWTPAQRKWHHCIGCDGTGQVPAEQEETR